MVQGDCRIKILMHMKQFTDAHVSLVCARLTETRILRTQRRQRLRAARADPPHECSKSALIVHARDRRHEPHFNASWLFMCKFAPNAFALVGKPEGDPCSLKVLGEMIPDTLWTSRRKNVSRHICRTIYGSGTHSRLPIDAPMTLGCPSPYPPSTRLFS